MQRASARQESLPTADSVVPRVMEGLLEWVLKKLKQGEDVQMSEFATQFQLHSEDSAHPLFIQVLGSTAIPYATRKRLIHQYDLWRVSEGEEFWADRTAAHQVRVSTKKAVGEIIKGSDNLRGHYINVHSRLAPQPMSSSSSNRTSNQGGPSRVFNKKAKAVGETSRNQKNGHEEATLSSPKPSATTESVNVSTSLSSSSNNNELSPPSTSPDEQFIVEASRHALEDGQDTAVSRSSSAIAFNKRKRDELLGLQEQEQPQQKKNRQLQEQGKEGDALSLCFFDFASVRPSELVIDGIDIGSPFKRLQEEASAIVNDVTKAMTLELLPLFMAANYIWDMTFVLPGMSDDEHNAIHDALHFPVARLPDQSVLFCCSLEHELTSKGYIKSRETSRDQDALLILFQQASQKLPRKFLHFKHLKNEDSHAHSVLDALLTFMFPSNHRQYDLHWANRPSAGSSDRRNGDAYKPDATLLKDGLEMGYVEVKSPKEERHQRPYLEDIWALSGFAKDNIDLHLRHSRIITTVPCIIVFGFQMTLYKLSFQTGIYLWQEILTTYLPKDQYDIGNIRACVELVKTFKTIMDEVETKRYVRTPTKPVEDDEDLLDIYRPRPTNISPSRRPFFCHTRRTSV
ncbi:hypothetical protein BGX34_005361 [Mortierella sp. NVP85]|nr:hypothetical protein BGX34_005361 [Mortierella sp. NVP85]